MAFIGPNGTRCSFGECDNRTESPTFGGVVPRQYSSGGKQKLFGISKRGNVYLRRMLIHGARAVLFRVKYDSGGFGQ